MNEFYDLLNPVISDVMTNSLTDEEYDDYDRLLMMLYADDGNPNS